MRISDWSSDVCSSDLPIVPIVIHNATDVAPKNEFVMRPATVRVTVLPPVDTAKWSVRTMGSHVRDVRNMFLPIGRASCRERVCQYVLISVVAVSLKKQNTNQHK